MDSHRHNNNKNKKFLTLRLWEIIDFELKYLENRKFPTTETFFIKHLVLESPCMQYLGVIWKVHITAESPPEITNIDEEFAKLDIDNDGFLSHKEFDGY
jgi:hypothetical protein